MQKKSIAEFEKEIRARFMQEINPRPHVEQRVPTDIEEFFIRELAMMSAFMQHSLLSTIEEVSKQLGDMQSKIDKAISEIKYPNRSIQ